MGLLDEIANSPVARAIKGGIPGLLSSIDSAKRSAARKIIGLLSDPEAYTEQRIAQIKEDGPEKLADALVGMAPGGIPGGIVAQTAWHGSPHKFNKFDLSKIGTGEGAQAYGHGLYLAENKSVAEEYKQAGKYLDDLYYKRGSLRASRQKVPKELDDEIAELEAKAEGQLYKTDIPDEAVARMLDWDKPLSQQAPEVQKQLKRLYWENWDEIAAKNPTGEQLYSAYGPGVAARSGWMDDAKVGAVGTARMLGGNGIPGIRYLDGGSRSSGQGTSNFVVFDPEIIRILERNGEATGAVPWSPGEWKGLLSP
jgi:hypothetical protein